MDWLTSILLIMVLLVTWMTVRHRKRMEQVFRAAFSYRFVNQLMRDGDLSRELINTVLSIVFIFLTAILLFLTALHSGYIPTYESKYFLLFVKVLSATGLYFFGRIYLHRVVGVVFKTQVPALEYNVNSFIINHIATIIVLPLIISVVFTSNTVLLYTSVFIYSSLLLYSIIRGSFIGTSIKKFSVFYLFLYLCTLEILPLLVIVKILEMRFL
jgi:hypothetical protein